MSTEITVIIPTTADVVRQDMLLRAIISARSARIIVVVNGDRYDPILVECLKNDRSIDVFQLREGNVSAARMMGLSAVTTPYFSFLDDDDELLPDALETRLLHILADDDVLVTNGFLRNENGDNPLVSLDQNEINRDPIGCFLRQNWFASAAGIFRTAGVDRCIFDISLKHFEWTWLFFALQTAGIRMRYVDELTYRIHGDHRQRASHSVEYLAASAGFLQSLMSLPLSPPHSAVIRRKYQTALNVASVRSMENGEYRKAWSNHVRCLASGGWRYVPYTRHLLLSAIRLPASLRGKGRLHREDATTKHSTHPGVATTNGAEETSSKNTVSTSENSVDR